MPARKLVERRLEIGMRTIEGPIMRVIAGLRDYEEEYGQSARLEVEFNYDNGDSLYLVYESPETDEEYAARRSKRKQKKDEQAEYAHYRKLKAKFEPEEDDV